MLSPSFLVKRFSRVTVVENSVGTSNPSIESIVITPAPLVDETSILSYFKLSKSLIFTSIAQFTVILDVILLIKYVQIPSPLKFTLPFSNRTWFALANVSALNLNEPFSNHTLALSTVPEIYVYPVSSPNNFEICKL